MTFVGEGGGLSIGAFSRRFDGQQTHGRGCVEARYHSVIAGETDFSQVPCRETEEEIPPAAPRAVAGTPSSMAP